MSLSYCRSAEDVIECKDFLASIGAEHTKVRPSPLHLLSSSLLAQDAGPLSPARMHRVHRCGLEPPAKSVRELHPLRVAIQRLASVCSRAGSTTHPFNCSCVTNVRPGPGCLCRSSPSARRASPCSTSAPWWTPPTPSSCPAATWAWTWCAPDPTLPSCTAPCIKLQAPRLLALAAAAPEALSPRRRPVSPSPQRPHCSQRPRSTPPHPPPHPQVPEKMAMIQKAMISTCAILGKPSVITRVVDTMIRTPRPTR